MQTPIQAKFEISIFSKFGFQKHTKSAHENIEKYNIGTSKPQIRFRFWNLGAGNLTFKVPKSFSTISPESQFGTIKFEISDLENPKILIFASKFQFTCLTKILILY